MRKKQEIKIMYAHFTSPQTDEERLNLLKTLYGFHDTKEMLYWLAKRAKENKEDKVCNP